MNNRKDKLDRLEQALWQHQPTSMTPPPMPPIEVWQSNVMRAVRLAADRGQQEWEIPWLSLRRAATLLVLVSALSWLAVWFWGPAQDAVLAQAAWVNSAETINSGTWNLE